MGRRHRWRRVSVLPPASYYKPANSPAVDLHENNILVEEAEAVRLKDMLGLEQEDCAVKMRVSRRTFCRLLESARGKIADALINGKAIRIQGGNFHMAESRYRCIEGHEWQESFESMIKMAPQYCPRCKTPSIMPLPVAGRHGRGHGAHKL